MLMLSYVSISAQHIVATLYNEHWSCTFSFPPFSDLQDHIQIMDLVCTETSHKDNYKLHPSQNTAYMIQATIFNQHLQQLHQNKSNNFVLR